MSFGELGGRLAVACRSGTAEYTAVYGRAVLLTSVFPRAMLQAAFLTLVGRFAGGQAGARFAFVGAVAFSMAAATLVRLPDVLVVEKDDGTFFRLRTGVLPPELVAYCRAWVYVAEALVSALLTIAVVGPLLGQAGTAAALVPLLPVLVLMAFGCAALGFTGATLAVGRRADALVGNALAYLVLVGAQVVAPVRVRWLDAASTVLPLRHGLAALRAHLDGRPWLGALAAEAAVGLGWLAAGVLALRTQMARSRRRGIDDYD